MGLCRLCFAERSTEGRKKGEREGEGTVRVADVADRLLIQSLWNREMPVCSVVFSCGMDAVGW